jgi:hypothetical protein
MGKLNELLEELKTVLTSQGRSILDSLLPLALFLILYPFLGLNTALWISLGGGVIFLLVRVFQRKKLRYTLVGLGAAAVAAGFVFLSGSETGFVIPGLISGGITVLLCLGSLIMQRPLAAWTSYITRRWPLGWYWHQQVRPAYNEVTLVWAIAFAGRLALEYWLSLNQSIALLGITKIALGWPYTILILIISYLYGIWRLGRLNGPSVEEYKRGVQPPWTGQKRGF